MQRSNVGWKKVMKMSQLAEGFNSGKLEQLEWIGKYYDPEFEWLVSVEVTDMTFLLQID